MMLMLKQMAADTAGPPWVASIAVATTEMRRFAANAVATLMVSAVSMADTEGMASIVVAVGAHCLTLTSIVVVWMAADTAGSP